MSRKILSFLFCILLYLNAYMQDYPPMRIEFECEKDNHDYSFEIAENQGAVVYYKTSLLNKDTAVWVFLHYDVNLQKRATTKLPLPNLANPITSCHDSNATYFLFKRYPMKSMPLSWFFVKYDLKTHQIKVQFLPIELTEVSNMKVDGDYVFLISNEEKDEGFQSLNFNTLQNYTYHFENQKVESVNFFEIDARHKKLYLGLQLVPEDHPKQVPTFMLLESDYSFQQVGCYPYLIREGGQWNSSRCAILDSGLLILGTYSISQSRKMDVLSAGVYSMLFRNSTFERMQVYSYSSLRSKDSLMYEMNLKNPNLQLLVGEVYGNKNQYALVTEVFYPEYTQSNVSYNTFGYSDLSAPMNTFNGYRFVNAYITTFDGQGNLLWDNYFPFTQVLTRSLYTKVGVHLDEEDNGYIYYTYSNRLTSTLVRGYTVIEPIYTQEMETNYLKDRVEYTRNIQVNRWYGDYFLESGYQYIKNESYAKKKRRFVFFLSKLQYD